MFNTILATESSPLLTGDIAEPPRPSQLVEVPGSRCGLGFDAEIPQPGQERIHDRLPLLFIEQQRRELQSTRNMLELQRIMVASSDEPLHALNRFAWRLSEMTNADRVAIYLVARRAGESVRAVVQQDRSSLPGVEPTWPRQEQLLVNRAIEAELCGRCDGDSLRLLTLNTSAAVAVAAPLRVKGRVLGALCAAKRDDRGLGEWDRQMIEFAVETLSHSMRRVLDEATIWRQARHDHLTGLVNRRSFEAYLETAIERVRLGTMPECSLILADLDHFKLINDQFGHQAGDHVLHESAQVLSRQMTCLRIGENSVVARFGGEEFAILLPNIGEAGACRVAEQIRTAIAAQNLRVENQLLPVTISLGVASCPGKSVTSKSLISAADKALYQAKFAGRNCTCCADSTLVESPRGCDDLNAFPHR